MDLIDPTADYCKRYANIMTKYVKGLIEMYYRMFRLAGCIAIDSIRMARESVQEHLDKCDFGVNFDGPMI